MADFITLNSGNIDKEHICCAISDKKCKEGYALKKRWLTKAFEHGYVFRRLNERAKVFIEYGPAEYCWAPITAPNYLFLGCFWVSGRYKKQGYAKQLLQFAIDDALAQGREGLVTIAGVKKNHFMSDGKWLLKQGFQLTEILPNGCALYIKKLTTSSNTQLPYFNDSCKTPPPRKEGITIYYSNRCPFTEYHINNTLIESTKNRDIPLHVVKFNSYEEAQQAPTPATIFSLYYNGEFMTTDISSCIEKRLEKLLKL